MRSFWQLFLANLKIVYRNTSGIFWTVLMPSFIYVALSVLPIKRALGVQLNYSNYVLPGIVAMTIMQGGIYGLAYWMVDMRSRGVIKRFLVTPLRPWQLVVSLLASRAVIMLAQVVVLTLLGVAVFDATFAGNVLSTVVFVVLGGSIFLTFGLLISSFASSYESAAPITSAIGLPLTFLGNIFYPVDVLPGTLKIVAKLLPITYLADGLRQSYLGPVSWGTLGFDLFVLSGWLLGMLLLTAVVFKLKE